MIESGAATFAFVALLLLALPLLLTFAKFVTLVEEDVQTLLRDAARSINRN